MATTNVPTTKFTFQVDVPIQKNRRERDFKELVADGIEQFNDAHPEAVPERLSTDWNNEFLTVTIRGETRHE